MSAEEGLLLDVVEHPEDDTPRLVYADWLDEHGGAKRAARAELIRVQCELARLPEEDDRVPALRRREEELLARPGDAWVKALDVPAADYEFRRGFVEQVALGVRQFLTQAEALFRATPVRRLKLLRLSQSKIPVAELAG